jgi:hypothetical protein
MSTSKAFGLLFVVLSVACLAQDKEAKPAYDSSQVEVRHIDGDALEKLKTDPEMSYGQSPAAISLWERLQRWFMNFIRDLFSMAASVDWMRTLIIGLAIVLVVFVILRILNVNALNMFYPKTGSPLNHGVLDEDIHTMDFDKLIEDALARNEFRLAVRLLFLHALKLLADHHHITWQPGKTNHDYLEELSARHLKTGFNELNFYFEYVWYGNFTIREPVYRKAELIFRNWKKAL